MNLGRSSFDPVLLFPFRVFRVFRGDSLLLTVGAVCCLACSGLRASEMDTPRPQQAPKFKVTLRRSDDTVVVTTEEAQTVFTVKSPFGISQAVIERLGDKWPKVIVLRLHLKALEHFSVANGKVILHAVAGVRERRPEVREWKDNQEDQPLRRTDPLWIGVRIVGADGKPAQRTPLAGGYFELTLPQALFDGNPGALTVRWIDFYR